MLAKTVILNLATVVHAPSGVIGVHGVLAAPHVGKEPRTDKDLALLVEDVMATMNRSRNATEEPVRSGLHGSHGRNAASHVMKE